MNLDSQALRLSLALFVGGACLGVSAADDKPKPPVTLPLKDRGSKRCDVQWMAFAPLAEVLVVRYAQAGSSDATLAAFDVVQGKPLAAVTIKGGGGHDNSDAACSVSRAGDRVAYAENGRLRFLSLVPGGPGIAEVNGEVALSRDATAAGASVWVDVKGGGPLLYSSHSLTPALERWNAEKKSWSVLSKFPPEGGSSHAHTLHPGQGRFALSFARGADERPQLGSWSVAGEVKGVTTETATRATALAYSSDGAVLAAGFADGSVAWYDAGTLDVAHKPRVLGRKFTVATVAFHPSGRYLACGTHDKGMPNLFVVHTGSGATIAKLNADATGVRNICFSHDGKWLATYGGSGEVTIRGATALLEGQQEP